MNNNDKQLLIDAARAVGLKHDGICEDFFDPECTLAKGLLIGEFIPWVWNPLDDDGQAFRLMVDLRLDICLYEHDVYCGDSAEDDWNSHFSLE